MRRESLHLFILLALLPYYSIAGVISVCPDCDISSIRQAIALSLPGDTVIVKKGVYNEANIIVDRSLTIIGEDFPVIDGNMKDPVLIVSADSCTVEGLHLKNVGVSHLEDHAGIRVKRSSHFVITGNKLSNTFFGIYLEHASKGVIINNEIIGEAVDEMSSGNAIHLWYCKNVRIENNHVQQHRDGIYLEFVDSSFVTQNTSVDNLRYGLHFMFSNDDEYTYNTFQRNGAGVAVMFSKKIDMSHNLFDRNWGHSSYGLLLKEIYDAEITANVFRSNSIAIFIEGSTRINYFNNHFERNGWAIKMSGGCLDNVIKRNNFSSNTFDLAIQSSPNNNSFSGNFWSDYSGYDLDRNGTGDVPHRPVKLFNFVVNRTPEAIVLLRSLFIDILNFSERVSPGLTPAEIKDDSPIMSPGTIPIVGAS